MGTSAATTRTAVLTANQYGKARVRVARVERGDQQHRMIDRTVRVALRGDFEAVHLAGDNSQLLATDTMKNTVYVLSEDAPDGEQLETFILRAHDHFAGTGSHLSGVLLEASEQGWRRIEVSGKAHPYAFEQLRESRTARVDGWPGRRTVSGGVEELSLLKTTDSWFKDFPRTEFTTLPDTEDRVLATIVTGTWRFSAEDADFAAAWTSIRAALTETFATHPSPSVQATLYEMAAAALEACADIEEVTLTLPNRHYLPVDLRHFDRGLGNVLQPTDEPHGLIEATVARG